MCSCLFCAPNWEPEPEPRHVPWLGIKLVTLWFTDWRSIQWATPARAQSFFSYSYVYSSPTQISMSIPSPKTLYWSIWNPQSPHWMFLLPLCSGGRMYVTNSATALLTGYWDTHTCFSCSFQLGATSNRSFPISHKVPFWVYFLVTCSCSLKNSSLVPYSFSRSHGLPVAGSHKLCWKFI